VSYKIGVGRKVKDFIQGIHEWFLSNYLRICMILLIFKHILFLPTLMDALKYPIGPFIMPSEVSDAWIKEQLTEIKLFPSKIKECLITFSPDELQQRYRPGGWTAKEVVHHCADSHMNAYIRFKCALTESNPVIKPYNETAWANLSDSQRLPPEVSVQLLEALHLRWWTLLEAFSFEDWHKTFMHPETSRNITLLEGLGSYAWHGRHHIAHLKCCKENGYG
jgi:hypothetical protein